MLLHPPPLGPWLTSCFYSVSADGLDHGGLNSSTGAGDWTGPSALPSYPSVKVLMYLKPTNQMMQPT